MKFLAVQLLAVLFMLNCYADAKRICAGCPVDQDINDPEIKKQLGEVLAGHNEDGEVMRIISAKTQVVNGIRYIVDFEMKDPRTNEVKVCHTSYVSRPWISKQLFVNDFSCEQRRKSSRLQLGSLKDVDKNEMSLVSQLADMAVKTLDDIDADNSKRVVAEIIDAKKQLVNGIMYHLSLRVKTTACNENGNNVPSGCLEEESIKQEICNIQVHRSFADSSPLNAKVVKSECDRDSSILSGPTDAPEESELIKEAAHFAAERISEMSNSIYRQVLVRIVEATSKIASSSNLDLILELGNTECMKNMHKQDNCGKSVSQNSEKMICRVSVSNEPLTENEKSKMKLISFNCGPFYRTKRALDESESTLKTKNKRAADLKNASKNEPSNVRQKRVAEILELEGNDKEIQNFVDFMEREKKSYENEEETVRRFRIFKANMRKAAFYQKHEQGTAVYGASIFADLTSSEFKKYLGFKVNPNYKPRVERKMAPIPNITLPDEYDWRNYNVVTSVKNQGMCGSCWAFSVTGNIEGLWAIQNQELLSLSEQELVDCDTYDKGCNGGDFDTAYHAIEDMGGLETETDYPYKGWSDKCHLDKSEIKVSISGGYNVSNDEEEMAKYLVANGPISIALNANAMQFYMGGVSHPFKFLCSPSNLDHGVLIVGYGVHRTRFTHKNLPYWLIKNSWGSRWGNQGYYMLYRGDGSCGVNQMPTTAILS